MIKVGEANRPDQIIVSDISLGLFSPKTITVNIMIMRVHEILQKCKKLRESVVEDRFYS